jgi:hypothetical protein
MSGARDDLSALTYALFALEQPLPLADLALGAADVSFPALVTHTPTWFAAAAMGSDLLAIAPELREIPADEAGGDRDLISVYAPELGQLEELDDPNEPSSGPQDLRARSADAPDASIRIGLLQELSDLDD